MTRISWRGTPPKRWPGLRLSKVVRALGLEYSAMTFVGPLRRWTEPLSSTVCSSVRLQSDSRRTSARPAAVARAWRSARSGGKARRSGCGAVASRCAMPTLGSMLTTSPSSQRLLSSAWGGEDRFARCERNARSTTDAPVGVQQCLRQHWSSPRRPPRPWCPNSANPTLANPQEQNLCYKHARMPSRRREHHYAKRTIGLPMHGAAPEVTPAGNTHSRCGEPARQSECS